MTPDVTDLEGPGDAMEIVLDDPDEYLGLYQFTYLLDTHAVRIVIPVKPGFSKAVKLAAALDFAVKLDIRQPDPELLEEVEEVLNFYLHHIAVRQPIDFFQTTLTSFLYDDPISLWEINEETPRTLELHEECQECEFFNRCGGYFKWPDTSYSCDGVKRVFQTLATAADALRTDLAAVESMEVQAQQ